MSANFCDENPDQGTTNEHCFHVVSQRAEAWKAGMPKTRRVLVVTSQCCWCGDKSVERRSDPLVHGKKALVQR